MHVNSQSFGYRHLGAYRLTDNRHIPRKKNYFLMIEKILVDSEGIVLKLIL